jgi:outer membrane protein TolC
VGYQLNQCLPHLNFNTSIGRYAIGSTGQNALTNIGYFKMVDWSIGIEARVPLLFGTKARSDLIAARLKSQAALDNSDAKEYELLNTLILIKDRLESLKERIKKARNVVTIREKILNTEMSSIKTGKSNFRRAYALEENLSKAKQWELESHVLFKLTRLQWDLICGTLLQNKGFETVKNDKPVLIEHLSGPYKYLLWFLLKDKEKE